MKVEVEVISIEIIKPSSPTPNHLRLYQLSFLDQTSPKHYNPLVFFYDLNGDHNINDISNKIKKSLSEVLTLFYPLAGRVKTDQLVDCNDGGASYSVARVNSTCQLSDVIKDPLPTDLCKFLPFELHQLTEFPLGIQLNIFEGGGIAVGLCISHQFADALSCIMFVGTWVAISRGEVADDGHDRKLDHPEFVAATIFPPKDDPGYDASASITTDVKTKRFVFDASTIEAIRSQYEEGRVGLGGHHKRTSRVEALSAFIWSRFVAATRDELSPELEKVYTVIHAVNLRPRFDPPLSEHTFGNISRCSFATFSGEEDGFEVVRRIREGFKKVNMDYLRKVREGKDSQLDLIVENAQNITMRGGQLSTLVFTSLCRFPLYDADFGWGEPTWVSSASLCFNNLVAFLDAKAGNGIEAYIGLKDEQMAKLEADEDFLRAASPLGA
ncbi:Transferase [Parasponia andersonii]|uniref:Transferase n=1 Tax=Parasponia andersonii TaxID=3476 RepID=A0A2P5AT66_PARAD|nr:Transferase [Parasponia andersonii]